MAEEQVQQGQKQDQIPVFVELAAQVKENITAKQQDGTIRKMVIEQLSEQEVQRRVTLVVKGFEARKAQQREVDKLKPDVKHVDETGKVTAEHYTPAVQKQLKQAKEKLAKIDKALKMALNESNYDELNKVASGKVDEKPADGEQTSE